MCVIAVSKKGIRQPSVSELRSMWVSNPHGAGYMLVRNDRVEIHKGFLYWDDFIRSVRSEKFSASDAVVYHFRISTQAGICEEMTHPFPIVNNLKMMKALDLYCDIGIAHNGIIPLTTTFDETEYSDTALFVSNYVSRIVRSPADMLNPYVQEMIAELGQSKFALMDFKGNIVTIGKFYNHDGILLSNENHIFRCEKFFADKEPLSKNYMPACKK